MNSVNLNMRSVQVDVGTREIRAEWTSEMANDVSSFASMDASKELEMILKAFQRPLDRKKAINNIYKNRKTT